MNQLDFIRRIYNLKMANPALEIHFCIDSGEINESGWTDHKITNVETSPWYQSGDRIMTKESDIMEHFIDRLPDGISEYDTDQIVEELFRNEVKEVICIYTTAA
jgi:hypothetical protein